MQPPDGGLPTTERTLADSLRALGYQTAICGKWHLGEFDPKYLPLARGFDRQYGHYSASINYFTHMAGPQLNWFRNGKPVEEEGYATDLLAAEACDMVAKRDPAKPLFLYVPFNAVHAPLHVPPHYTAPFTNLKGPRRALAGMQAALDKAIGQIVAAVEAAGIRDNTLIVFSSDNGGIWPGTNGPLRDFKGSLYEGGIRTCAFATWPGRIPAGQRIKQPMHVVDWYPTFVKLAGGTLDADAAAGRPRRLADAHAVRPLAARADPHRRPARRCRVAGGRLEADPRPSLEEHGTLQRRRRHRRDQGSWPPRNRFVSRTCRPGSPRRSPAPCRPLPSRRRQRCGRPEEATMKNIAWTILLLSCGPRLQPDPVGTESQPTTCAHRNENPRREILTTGGNR